MTGPLPCEEPLVAFDRARNTVVLYGGNRLEPGPFLTDTWEWNGAGWAQRASTGSTLPMGGAMTFDSRSGQLVLFDGDRSSADRASSGLWNGTGQHGRRLRSLVVQRPHHAVYLGWHTTKAVRTKCCLAASICRRVVRISCRTRGNGMGRGTR